VTQDVFVALLGKPERFDPNRAAISTWLCGIARRLVWKQLERRQRYSAMEFVDGEETLESEADDPGVAFHRKEAVAAVRRGLEELPVALREVIVLCEFEDMKYEDAALVLDVPIGTVRSRLHRAKARLGELLRGPLQISKSGKESDQ
jgi:RNA polymerase sigma factor (sigma-70 family)